MEEAGKVRNRGSWNRKEAAALSRAPGARKLLTAPVAGQPSTSIIVPRAPKTDRPPLSPSSLRSPIDKGRDYARWARGAGSCCPLTPPRPVRHERAPTIFGNWNFYLFKRATSETETLKDPPENRAIARARANAHPCSSLAPFSCYLSFFLARFVFFFILFVPPLFYSTYTSNRKSNRNALQTFSSARTADFSSLFYFISALSLLSSKRKTAMALERALPKEDIKKRHNQYWLRSKVDSANIRTARQQSEHH